MKSFFINVQPRNSWQAVPVILAAAAVAAVPEPVSAQDGSGLVLEEITVTAQRREESLQDVPVSVSAYSAETIERARH